MYNKTLDEILQGLCCHGPRSSCLAQQIAQVPILAIADPCAITLHSGNLTLCGLLSHHRLVLQRQPSSEVIQHCCLSQTSPQVDHSSLLVGHVKNDIEQV